MTDMKNTRTGKTFLGVSVAIFIAKLLGFSRDIILARVFGTSVLNDIFQVIFGFPSLIFSSIGTALSSVNIPDLTYFAKHRSLEERNQYLGNLLAQISLLASLVTLLGIVLAPAIVRLIWPALAPETTHIAVLLTRIMMPTLLFVSLTFLATGVLQVHSHFLLSATISIPFNVFIIAALLWRGNDIAFLGYVTTLGWLLQFLIQLPVLIKEKYTLRFHLDFHDRFSCNTFRNLLPILMGNSLLQVCLFIDRYFSASLPAGTASALSFGSTLFITITSVFIVAMTTVVFPRLSQHCLEGDYPSVRAILEQAFKMLFFILLPYLLLVICYHRQIVALIYQHGAFNSQSTDLTSQAFLLYSFAVLGYLCQEVYNRVYYALKRFSVPMVVSLFCLTINVILDYLFYKTAGITGLSLSTALCLLLYAIIMTVMVSREIGNFINRDLAYYLLKLILPSASLLAVAWGFHLLGGSSLIMGFLLPLFTASIVYLGVAHLCGLSSVFFAREASH
ncbi:MAG TPA: murein biosynthesis integral membrane protein MurJ [Syntrophomonadaceae bacterium]|nr:murein biosynthesis integral membrane protein MurJ [Syntrophomonadaceae bacterium]